MRTTTDELAQGKQVAESVPEAKSSQKQCNQIQDHIPCDPLHRMFLEKESNASNTVTILKKKKRKMTTENAIESPTKQRLLQNIQPGRPEESSQIERRVTFPTSV